MDKPLRIHGLHHTATVRGTELLESIDKIVADTGSTAHSAAATVHAEAALAALGKHIEHHFPPAAQVAESEEEATPA